MANEVKIEGVTLKSGEEIDKETLEELSNNKGED